MQKQRVSYWVDVPRLRLARLFGNSPEFWPDAQRAVDLWDAAKAIKKDVTRIKPLRTA